MKPKTPSAQMLLVEWCNRIQCIKTLKGSTAKIKISILDDEGHGYSGIATAIQGVKPAGT